MTCEFFKSHSLASVVSILPFLFLLLIFTISPNRIYGCYDFQPCICFPQHLLEEGMKGKSVSGMNYYACLSIMSLVILTPFAIAMEGPQMWAAGWQRLFLKLAPMLSGKYFAVFLNSYSRLHEIA